jgi:CHAD domain-containing protein
LTFTAGYIKKQFSSIKQNLQDYAKEKKQEQIHNLRVDIKKLRAILSFLNFINNDKQLPKKIFSQLFTDARAIRENFINLTIFKTITHSPKLLYNFKVKDKVLKAQFSAKIPQYIKTVEKAEKKIKIPHYIPVSKEVKKYFNKLMRQSTLLFNNREDKNNIHRFRMKVKKMMYVYKTLPAEMQKSVGINEAYMDKLQMNVGKWHDAYLAIICLEKNGLGSTVQITKLKQLEKRNLVSLVNLYKNYRKKIRVPKI